MLAGPVSLAVQSEAIRFKSDAGYQDRSCMFWKIAKRDPSGLKGHSTPAALVYEGLGFDS